MKEKKLKRCPFCNSKNVGYTEGSGRAWGCVMCYSCGARSGEVQKARSIEDSGSKLNAPLIALLWEKRKGRCK